MAPKKTDKKRTRITNDHSAGIVAFEMYRKIKEFQHAKDSFEKNKKRVNDLFEEYFQACGTKKMVFVNHDDDSLQGGTVTVVRVQNVKVIWNIDKLKKQLGRKLFCKVVQKQYQIIDMHGLIEYLKSCGVDPNKFKSYINVSVSVDESEIDRLSEVGEVTKSDIEGCYRLDKAKPYFKYTYKASGDE